MVESYKEAERLFREAVRLVGVDKARIGTRIRRQLRVFFSRPILATNMTEALSAEGAETLLYSESGRSVLGLIRHRARVTGATRVGQASKHALLEDVNVNAVKAAGGR